MTGQSAARLLILAVFLIAPLSFAQDEEVEVILLDAEDDILAPLDENGTELAVPLPTQGVDANEVLIGLWFKHRTYRERGQEEQAERQVEIALEFMRREGLRTAPEIAASFLSLGRHALDEGDYPAALESFTLATRFQPTLASAHLGLGITLLRGDRDIGGALGAWRDGFVNLFVDPGSLYFISANGVLIAYVAICLGLISALIVLCLSSMPAFFHDLQEKSSGRLSEDGARLLGWSIVAVPLLVPVSPAWAFALWASLFVVYLKPFEKAVAAAALLFLILAGPFGMLLGWTFGTAVDPGARALIQAMRHGPDLHDETALMRLTGERPGEAIYPFLLATAYRAGGRFDDAMIMYRRVLEANPGHARALVNLGNLHALRQEFGVAQKYYQRAWSSDPSVALAHYNSHLAHLEVFHLEAADTELNEARRLDEGRINGLLQAGSNATARRIPVDTQYRPGEIWKRVTELHRTEGASLKIGRILRAPATLAGGFGLLMLFILPGLGLAPRKNPAQRCRRCGRPSCRRCQVASRHSDVCAQCTHLFVLRDGVAPGVKARKLEEVALYRKRRFVAARLFSLFAPGSGHVLGGRTIKGTLVLIGWLFAMSGLILRGRVLISPEEIAPAGWSGIGLFLIAIGCLSWLTGNLTTHEARRG